MALQVVTAQLRKGTAAEQGTKVLKDGQVGYSTDENELKVGDGVTAWAALPVANLPDNVATTDQLEAAVGAMIVAGDGIDVAYDAEAGTVTIAVAAP